MKEVLNCRCGGVGYIKDNGCSFYVECDTC